jgi:pimeloyl-ACP methyl ester carboxylesterase
MVSCLGWQELWRERMDSLLYLTLRGVAVLIAVIGLCAVSGATYQHFAHLSDLKRYPPPGRLIDIGGRRLHLLCAGKVSDHTVVIEAGSGNDVTLWQGIVGRVSRFTHVCAYDRAGLGWSDPVSGPRSFDDRARDLHSLLEHAGIAGPYILVGHSYGGYIVRRFAAAYPQSVAGIVLIDSPDEVWSFAAEGLLDAQTIGAQEWRRGLAAQFGLLRLATSLFPDRFDPLKGVPDDARGEQMALYLCSSRHFAIADEMAAYQAVPPEERGLHGFGRLGDTPLVVVSRGWNDPVTRDQVYPEWEEAQKNLASLSTNSLHVVAAGSGHMIQFTEPGVIVGAIRQLLENLGHEPAR